MDKGTKILIIFNSVLIVVLIAVYFTLFSETDSHLSRHRRNQPAVHGVPEIAEDREALNLMFRSTLGEEVDKFAIYLYRPKVEMTPIIFQSRPMRPASMIKVFVLAKVMQDAKDGKLALDELIPITAENIVFTNVPKWSFIRCPTGKSKNTSRQAEKEQVHECRFVWRPN